MARLASLAILGCACKAAPVVNQQRPPKDTTAPADERADTDRAAVAIAPLPKDEGPLCDGVDLDVVAACIRQAVAIVQRIPESDAYGSLLAQAARSGRLDRACADLPGVGSGPALLTASGRPLAIEVSESAWDHMDDGAARRYVDVRIGCSCCSEVVTFTVIHTVGGP